MYKNYIDQNLHLKILFQCNNLPIYDSVDVKKVTKSSNIKFVVIVIDIVLAIVIAIAINIIICRFSNIKILKCPIAPFFSLLNLTLKSFSRARD